MKKLLIILSIVLFAGVLYSQEICLTQTEKDVLEILNQKRSEKGLKALQISPVLMLTANKNAQEIIEQSYLVHKPSKFGEYNFAYEQIRYSSSVTGAAAIARSLTTQSAYTNYYNIIFQSGEFSTKNWHSAGISLRGSTILLILGEKLEKPNVYKTCSSEVFFDAEELPQNPILSLKLTSSAYVTIHAVQHDGSSYQYHKQLVKNNEYELEIKDGRAESFIIQIYPEFGPIVPQKEIKFTIKNSEKGKIEKAISLNGNTVAEIQNYINSGIKINHVLPNDPNGYTMLHRAVMQNNIVAVEYLIKTGADINLKGYDGETPIFFVSSNEMFELLKKHNPKYNIGTSDKTTLLHSFAQKGLLEPVRFIVDNKKVDINAKDRKGGTALMSAVQFNHYDVAKYLLEKGAVQSYGWLVYPIHDAVRNANLEMVKLLVKHGADINCKNGSGETPLSYAKKYPSKKAEIIEFLIQNGAK